MRPASCALRTRTSKRRRGVRGDRARHERTKPRRAPGTPPTVPHRTSGRPPAEPHRPPGRPPAVPHRTSGRPPAEPHRTSGRPPTVRTDHAASATMETVIGLEVHAQLLTRSKMFCGCPTTFGAPPNSQTCPVCQGMPGVLPVVNRRAVELGIRAALAFECRVNAACRFARKHYYYPDMPKNYQITQYEEPLAEDGHLEIEVDGASRTIGIQRLHLEEDVGKLLHEGTLETAQASLVDYNRSGVPLMETVSRPDLRSAEEAAAYLKAFRAVLVFLGVSNGNMEEGSLRCDANVSLRPRGSRELGTKVEIKNMNSFRSVKQALEFEVRRQAEALAAGERIVQETRLWDADRGYTRAMRSKEYAHDYRYFPEPDLAGDARAPGRPVGPHRGRDDQRQDREGGLREDAPRGRGRARDRRPRGAHAGRRRGGARPCHRPGPGPEPQGDRGLQAWQDRRGQGPGRPGHEGHGGQGQSRHRQPSPGGEAL